ncbi:hypothetical protein ACLB2K_015384 [Fragaria x ananassa]
MLRPSEARHTMTTCRLAKVSHGYEYESYDIPTGNRTKFVGTCNAKTMGLSRRLGGRSLFVFVALSISRIEMASTMLSLASSLSFHDTHKGKIKLASLERSNLFLNTESAGRVSMVAAVKTSRFDGVTMAPPDPILGVSEAFKASTNPMKLNLGVGAYRTEELQPYVLNVVKKAENLMLERGENKEYLPIEGLAAFNKATAELLFGADNPVIKEKKVATVQGLSGTGSLRLAAAFIERYFPGAKALISSPTWGNHKNIFNDAGVPWSEYRYYDPKTVGLDFEGMIADIKAAPEGSFILLHGCAHNPTGIDPTPEQWEKIADVIQEKNHIPFFDVAYQEMDAQGYVCTEKALNKRGQMLSEGPEYRRSSTMSTVQADAPVKDIVSWVTEAQVNSGYLTFCQDSEDSAIKTSRTYGARFVAFTLEKVNNEEEGDSFAHQENFYPILYKMLNRKEDWGTEFFLRGRASFELGVMESQFLPRPIGRASSPFGEEDEVLSSCF